MTLNLKNRNFLTLLDFTPGEIQHLLDLARELKAAKHAGTEQQHLRGKNIALIFEKTSTRTRCAFEVAAHDQGANVTYLGPTGTQIGVKESMKDTARVLARLYDGIEYRGFGQSTVEELGRYGVPVWNGLTDEYQPTQVLADLLTICEHSAKLLTDVTLCFIGVGCGNMADSLLVGAAQMGMKFRVAAPVALQPEPAILERCRVIASATGAHLSITADPPETVEGADFVYTDVWVSLGEPNTVWEERIKSLEPYRVTGDLLARTGNPDVRFMHCLPAFHNRKTRIGEDIFEKFGLSAMEVTEDVFESDASIVFDQAENRMHTIKAVLVVKFRQMVPIGRFPKFVRKGARSAVMPGITSFVQRIRRAWKTAQGVLSRDFPRRRTPSTMPRIACGHAPTGKPRDKILWVPSVRFSPLVATLGN